MCRPPWSWPGKGSDQMSRPAGQTALDTLGEVGRAEAHRRWLLLRAHLEDGVPLTRVAAQSEIAHRKLQRWLARYQAGGLAGLGRAARADRGGSRFPEPLRLLVEGLALRTPVPSAARVHRQVTAVAEREGWPVPSYSWVYAIICGIDPALSADELVFVLQHHWSKLSLTPSADDFTDAEALAAVARITGGNFRLVQRLFAQIQRIMEINNLSTVTRKSSRPPESRWSSAAYRCAT
jgi:Homeodomain-like domain